MQAEWAEPAAVTWSSDDDDDDDEFLETTTTAIWCSKGSIRQHHCMVQRTHRHTDHATSAAIACRSIQYTAVMSANNSDSKLSSVYIIQMF